MCRSAGSLPNAAALRRMRLESALVRGGPFFAPCALGEEVPDATPQCGDVATACMGCGGTMFLGHTMGCIGHMGCPGYGELMRCAESVGVR